MADAMETTTTSTEEVKPFKRLSKAIQPLNYKLRLEPNLDTFKCVGEEIVDVEVGKFYVALFSVPP